MSTPVPLTVREQAVLEAEQHACEVCERWLEARAGGTLTPELEAELNEASRVLRGAQSRLDRARRQVGRRVMAA